MPRVLVRASPDLLRHFLKCTLYLPCLAYLTLPTYLRCLPCMPVDNKTCVCVFARVVWAFPDLGTRDLAERGLRDLRTKTGKEIGNNRPLVVSSLAGGEPLGAGSRHTIDCVLARFGVRAAMWLAAAAGLLTLPYTQETSLVDETITNHHRISFSGPPGARSHDKRGLQRQKTKTLPWMVCGWVGCQVIT
ncbi:hypothetical protein B0T19DRAFT_116491 [Cercophora scortea]|uniref:Uncharacterized protein n=1 Tax=Cercophora scortea TaxID=314031 RepID=A0AAE0MJ84_9PEZI|nr:hypothetical protein B0T19DRAFT_116491 [Cercophora scortea]